MEGLRRFCKETEQEVEVLTGISPNINAALLGLRFFIYLCSPNSIAMENELKKIYSGSVVNAEFIGSVLEQNDIQFLIRNYQEESLVAGWAAGTIKGDASVFVFDMDYERAMLLLDEIDESEIEEEE